MTTDHKVSPSTRIEQILARLRRLKELRAKADFTFPTQSSPSALAFIAEAANLTTPMVDGMILLIKSIKEQMAEYVDSEIQPNLIIERALAGLDNMFPQDAK